MSLASISATSWPSAELRLPDVQRSARLHFEFGRVHASRRVPGRIGTHLHTTLQGSNVKLAIEAGFQPLRLDVGY